MIRITETPHRLPVRTWTASDREDFIRRVRAAHEQQRLGTSIYERTTARELLDGHGYSPEYIDGDALHEAGWIIALGGEHGWDTPLYRADYIREGEYTPTPIDEYDACVAYLRHDLQALEIEEVQS